MNAPRTKRKSPGYRGGYVGNVLRVDLSSGKLSEEPLPDTNILRKYIGCWGLALRYLYDMVPPGIDALDKANPLIFMTGPLTGLKLTGATNITIATKNFNTGFTAGHSHTHGHFGSLLKNAGYDGLIITGKSDVPVYLWIHNNKAELRDASHLWRKKDSEETQNAVQEELGNSNISVTAIGPAGENLVAGGKICNDKNHSLSHSGIGSIMGSKKLKAIAVFGDQLIPLADKGKITFMRNEWFKHFQSTNQDSRHVLKDNKLQKDDYRGRAAIMGIAGKNFLENQLTEFGIDLSLQEWIRKPCPRCAIGCTYDVRVKTGPFAGFHSTAGPGSEPYETVGSILRIPDPGSYIYIAEMYNRLGIERSMAGCTIAMAIEAFEKGLITKEDTDGLELKWGDVEVAEALLKKMVNKEGFIGKTLALGIKRAAEQIGGDAPSFAVNINGAGLNLQDWKSNWGILFSHIAGSRAVWSASRTDYYAESDAGFQELTDRFDIKIKPAEAKMIGAIKFMNDCTGMCMYATWGTDGVLRLSADSINAATGWDLTADDMFALGLRCMHLERAFNIRHGLMPEDDLAITPGFIDPPIEGIPNGKFKKPHIVGMVQEYYRLMGWDERTGKPWRSTLEEAGLDEIAKDMWG